MAPSIEFGKIEQSGLEQEEVNFKVIADSKDNNKLPIKIESGELVKKNSKVKNNLSVEK